MPRHLAPPNAMSMLLSLALPLSCLIHGLVTLSGCTVGAVPFIPESASSTMGLTKLLSSVAVVALACMTGAQAQVKPLPWDGRGQDVTVATLENKFMLHILKQRQSGTGNPADYITVQPKGRSPAFNGDTGVINIAVDDKAIFGGQTTFRRTELVQNVAGETSGTTFFRASIMANSAIKNKHQWQVFFPESHQWEVFVDATVTPNKIQFRTEARVQWEVEFSTKTWYNFGIAVAPSGMTLYTSTGNAALSKKWSDNKAITPTNNYELHFGLLTLSQTGGAPSMVAGQDILSFNGVTVENKVSTSGGAGGASAPAPDAGADATPAPAPSQTTKAPANNNNKKPSPSPTVKPAPNTKAPTQAPATQAPPAGGKCNRRA